MKRSVTNVFRFLMYLLNCVIMLVKHDMPVLQSLSKGYLIL